MVTRFLGAARVSSSCALSSAPLMLGGFAVLNEKADMEAGKPRGLASPMRSPSCVSLSLTVPTASEKII